MEKQFYKKIILICIIFIFIGAFNFTLDPGNYFQRNNYKILSEATGKNILVTSNIDERILKKNLIENLEEAIEILILGSSRIMSIGKEHFKQNKKVFNGGVSSAGIKDILGILNIAEEKFDSIGTIFLGIDPWLFNKNEDKRYKSIENEYIKFLEKLNQKQTKDSFEKIKYLFRFSTLRDSFKVLKNKKNDLTLLESSIKQDENGNLFLAEDRSLVYSRKFISENNGNWKTYLGYQMYDEKELNQEKQKIFEDFINYCKNKEIELIFYLPPYNPKNYEYLSLYRKNDYEQLNKVENYVKEISNRYDIKLLGSYNNKKLEQYDFYDGIHLKREKIAQILIFK